MEQVMQLPHIAAQMWRCQKCGTESGYDDDGHWVDQPHDIDCPDRRPTDAPVKIHHLG